MTLSEHVFLYCERGTSTALLAEPWNAASNAGFILAALVGVELLMRKPEEQRSADQFLLAALIFLVGLGSISFHLFANRGTELADVIPIGVFMLVYLGFALNRFLGTPPGWTVLLVIGFAVIVAMARQLQCWDGGIGLPEGNITGATPCLNGSVAYLPALFALIIVGMLLWERKLRAAPYVLWAAAIFAVSITLRSIDLSVCDDIVYEGHKIGTHSAWHLLNAVVAFLLFLATFHAGEGPLQETEESEPEKAPSAVQQLALKQEAERLKKEEEAAKEEAATEEKAEEEADTKETPAEEKDEDAPKQADTEEEAEKDAPSKPFPT